MTWEQIQWTEELREIFGSKYDPDFIPEWYDRWSDYEESGFMFVLRKGDQYYLLEYNYSVMADDNEVYWDPWPCTEAQALERMIEWEESQLERERNGM